MNARWCALFAALVGIAGCGASSDGGQARSQADVERCQRLQSALEQRLALAEERIEELEAERDATEAVVAVPEVQAGEVETVRIQVPRDRFDALFQDSKQLMKSARVVPVNREGRVTGLRLFGIRAGSPLTLLGFENGDEVRSVNGHDVTSPEKALEAYSAVRRADLLDVSLVRRGRLLRLVLEIVDPGAAQSR